MSGTLRIALHRLGGVSRICRFSTTKATEPRHNIRAISWMAFEHLDPALYPAPPSLQAKRPVVDGVVAAAESSGQPTPPVVTAGVGATPTTSAARTREVLTSGRTMPPSSLRTGLTPLSQIQKRTVLTLYP